MVTKLDVKHGQILFTEEGEKRLNECIDFVNDKRPDLAENLKFQFNRHFEYFKHHSEIKMYVWPDFAPLSFYFEMRYFNFKTGRFEMDYNGGIIFHGEHDSGGSGRSPTYSVNLTPVDGWKTHT